MSVVKKQAQKGKLGVQLIQNERERQIDFEGYTAEHDDQHKEDQLAIAAAHYATPDWCVTPRWPFRREDNKKGKHDRIRELAIAGALIAAEIDRLARTDQSGEHE